MKARQFAAMMAAVMGMSFLGGLVSERIFSGRARAQAPAAPRLPKELPGGAPVEFISAQEFRLVDNLGRIYGKIMIKNNKRPMLEFYDEEGVQRLEVGLSDKGAPHFQLKGKKGGVRAALTLVEKEGQPKLMLMDQRNEPRLLLDLLSDGRPLVSLLDKNKKGRAQLSLSPNQDPSLTLHDKDGLPRAAFFMRSEGSPAIEYYDRDGKTIWKAP